MSDLAVVRAFIRKECFEGLSVHQLLMVLTDDPEIANEYSVIIAETEKLYGYSTIGLDFGNTYLGAGSLQLKAERFLV